MVAFNCSGPEPTIERYTQVTHLVGEFMGNLIVDICRSKMNEWKPERAKKIWTSHFVYIHTKQIDDDDVTTASFIHSFALQTVAKLWLACELVMLPFNSFVYCTWNLLLPAVLHTHTHDVHPLIYWICAPDSTGYFKIGQNYFWIGLSPS